MIYIIRNLLLAMLGVVVVIGALTAGFFVFLILAVLGVIGWVYLTLVRKGIINAPWHVHVKETHYDDAQHEVIETEYEIVENKDEPDQNPR